MRICIFGAGGFGHELIAPLRKGVTDLDSASELFFIDDAAPDEAALPVITLQDAEPGDRFIVAIGDGKVRRAIEDRCLDAGLIPIDYYGEHVSVGHGVFLGEGTVLCSHSMITANAMIGRQFQANIYSYVAHDCVIGDFVTFAPRVSCNGNVHIDDGAYIGTGAIIRNGTPEKPLKIGKHAIVGMGAVVTKDVPPGAVVIGNPARMREDPS